VKFLVSAPAIRGTPRYNSSHLTWTILLRSCVGSRQQMVGRFCRSSWSLHRIIANRLSEPSHTRMSQLFPLLNCYAILHVSRLDRCGVNWRGNRSLLAVTLVSLILKDNTSVLTIEPRSKSPGHPRSASPSLQRLLSFLFPHSSSIQQRHYLSPHCPPTNSHLHSAVCCVDPLTVRRVRKRHKTTCDTSSRHPCRRPTER
jgi:hypothetical protein